MELLSVADLLVVATSCWDEALQWNKHLLRALGCAVLRCWKSISVVLATDCCLAGRLYYCTSWIGRLGPLWQLSAPHGAASCPAPQCCLSKLSQAMHCYTAAVVKCRKQHRRCLWLLPATASRECGCMYALCIFTYITACCRAHDLFGAKGRSCEA